MTASDTAPATILKTFQAYVPLALRTEPDFVKLCSYWGFNHDGEPIVGDMGAVERIQAFVRLHHATIGLATEGNELDSAITEEHRLEEGGDIGWYTAQAFAAIEALMASSEEFANTLRGEIMFVLEKVEAPWDLKACVFAFVQDAKRFIFYQRADKLFSLVQHIAGILVALNNLATSSTQVDDLEHLLETNIAKLQKRYPDGYSDWHAKERADKDKETDDVQ